MAKADKDYSVSEKLANLYKLQLLVSEIDRIKSLRGELPKEVAIKEEELEHLKERVGRFRGEIAECQRRIDTMHHRIEEAQALIDQYSAQQDEVRNNKEYEFLTKEIEYQSLEIELCNKRVRENLESIEELRQREETTLNEIEERQNDLDIKKGELDEIIAETRNEEETLREKAKKIENTIEPKLLSMFKRIHKKAHNGLAIAAIEREACGGCFNRITPQRQIEVKMHKKIMQCEYCGRILIDEELANENEMRRRRKGLLAGL